MACKNDIDLADAHARTHARKHTATETTELGAAVAKCVVSLFKCFVIKAKGDNYRLPLLPP